MYGAPAEPEEGAGFPELELQVAVSYRIGAGTQLWSSTRAADE